MSSITISHVAERAGVSIKTVSRVMNGERYVRAELRDRVLEAARELNYRPQMAARSLAGRRSYVICMLLPQVSPYAVKAQLGVLEACQAAGCHLVIETVDPGATEALEGLARALPMDGMVLLPPICDDAALLDTLEARGIRYVRISPARNPRRGVCVFVDDEEAAQIMTEHLLDLGHERIGFVMGPPGHSASRQRLRGFRKAHAMRGVALDETLLAPGRFEHVSGREAAQLLLALDRRPTAIFAANDLSAAGVIGCAHDLGLRMPQVLSVAGFDDDLLASLVWPGLTTMHLPIKEMAAAATTLLIAAAAGGATPRSLRPFHCSLIVRGSTAPPPTPGRGQPASGDR